jgi:hypothetical protein
MPPSAGWSPGVSTPTSPLPGLGAPPQPTQFGSGHAGFNQPAGTWAGVNSTQFLTKLGSNAIISGLIAGAIGGAVGDIFGEIFASPNGFIFGFSTGGIDASAAVWVMVFATVLGFVLMGWEGFTSRSPAKMFREGGIGAAIGLGAGFIGGFIAQAIYGAIVPHLTSMSELLPVRGLGWAVLGALVGLGLGIRGGGRSTVNGLIGGAVGGFLAGIVFQWLTNNEQGSGTVPRFLGLTVTGIGIGLGVGLVTRVRRDAWLLFTGGPMQGKEFILQSAQTQIGSDYRCDIVLVKDPAVYPLHALLLRQPDGSMAVSPQSGAQVVVNGIATAGGRLNSGDSLVIGSSVLSYVQRAATW